MIIQWRKSTHSDTGANTCVELARLGAGERGIRDSKNPEAPHHTVSTPALAALVARVKAGELDLP